MGGPSFNTAIQGSDVEHPPKTRYNTKNKPTNEIKNCQENQE